MLSHNPMRRKRPPRSPTLKELFEEVVGIIHDERLSLKSSARFWHSEAFVPGADDQGVKEWNVTIVPSHIG